MKKYVVLFLIFFVISFNIIGLKTAFAIANTFKEGIYTINDLKPSKDGIYTIKNISKNNNIRLLVFNEDYAIIQSTKIEANSERTDMVPILPSYIIVIAGDGELEIDPK
ncbi:MULTISPECIES: hypothetical protein [unclassified Clostridium]|uniref:hypothetical protein n=1 Tax=unclassified Clostridium TaxID=2614128 RepID=UPI0002981136|nr:MULTISPECIES: hypothetical protein [unclassified Clostridium]EKQ54451.1 MAG: hypothetical protein A370_03275 [Clostridium sp. Maddingley MBC34-26]